MNNEDPTIANLHSFIDIFETDFKLQASKEGSVKLSKIEIPIIQRDYAQGRPDTPGRNGVQVSTIRHRYLAALKQAVIDSPIILDFVYGDINQETGVLVPLDGQQRLTSLFLLHWYAVKKDNIPEDETSCLGKFSYETRYSARNFCLELIKFSPDFASNTPLSEQIVNQWWFPLSWKKDPTISSMLVVLDDIDAEFREIPELWQKLANGAIRFYFLPIEDMGLTDELYIKMNSRGKPLTQFENLKAEFERELRAVDEKNDDNLVERITRKIDQAWTDLLWAYHAENLTPANASDEISLSVDEGFLNYFRFVCEILCFRGHHSLQEYGEEDVFALLSRYFSKDNPEVENNIATLESFFDCWCDIDGFANPHAFLESFISMQHEPEKVIIESRKVDDNPKDLLGDCLMNYSRKAGKTRKFSFGKMVLLYAIVTYLQHQSEISYQDFVRRFRIVNNLIQNSTFELSDRVEDNRIPAILEAASTIILTGEITEDIMDKSFNINQLREEQEKNIFVRKNPELAETLYTLEDHPLLHGQISIVGLENLEYVDNFAKLFACDHDLVDCALMATGNYIQRERNGRRYQTGSKTSEAAWNNLFHKSRNAGFDNTKSILVKLLSSGIDFSDQSLRDYIQEYLDKCEQDGLYPLQYYYVKYPSFRIGGEGKLNNDSLLDVQTVEDFNEHGCSPAAYLFSVIPRQRMSESAYMPYLKEADEEHLSKDFMGQRLVYKDKYIYCEDGAYVVCEREEEDAEASPNTDAIASTISEAPAPGATNQDASAPATCERILISQNENGIDTEDRIEKLRKVIRGMGK